MDTIDTTTDDEQDANPAADEANARGIELAEKGDTAGAETAFRRAIEFGSEEAWYNLGHLYELTDRPEEAAAAFRRSAELGNTGAYVKLGDLLWEELGRPEEAERAYRDAAVHGDTDALVNLGNMFTAGERFAEAKQAYREAIALGDEGASWQLADAVLQSEGLEAAEPWFRRAMDAGELRAARDLARAFFRADRVDEAEELYKLAINAGVPWARLGLADVLSHFVGREEEAEAMYLKAIDENDAPVPLVDLAHVNYGVFLVDEGRIEEAQQQLQEAIRAGADPETLGYLERALADP